MIIKSEPLTIQDGRFQRGDQAVARAAPIRKVDAHPVRLPAAEKTYCSAALISSPRAAFFLLHHAHQHAHRPLGAQLFGILQVSIGYCFLPFGASFEVYGLCSCLRTLLSRCLDPCSSSVVIPDIS